MNTTGCDGLPESSQDTHMNVSGESRKQTNDRKMEVLSTKIKTRIGFWNVRTMYETGKLAQVSAEMRRYNLHILGISESRWTGSGRYKTNTGETVLFSGRDHNQHHEGVAVILRKGMESAWWNGSRSTADWWRSEWRGSTSTSPTSSAMHRPMAVRKRARMHFMTSCKPS